jgi:hypothetical protein
MRSLLSWCGCLLLLSSSGCAICAHPYDAWYAAYGGVRQRTDMAHGRVGSVFDPAPEVSYPSRTQQSRQPTPAEEPERDTVVPEPSVSPGPQPPAEGPTTTPPLPATEEPLQEPLPEPTDGTLELPEPEEEPAKLPEPLDESPGQTPLPPDLPGNDDRSARLHPLQDLFDEKS